MNPRFAIRAAGIIAAAITVFSVPLQSRAADGEKPQYYEIQVYSTKSTEQQQRINDYWERAAVPAYNRIGCQPIGVFTEIQDSATNKIYVFIPSDSAEAFAAIPGKLAADTTYQAAAAEFLNAPKTNAAYESFSASLLVAFDGMKHLVVPPPDKKPEVFELRTYISSSEGKGLSKIHMFESGEITVMKEVGLAPIFYGRTVSGPVMPSLMYMTCGENMEAHKKHWAGFSAAPVWKQLQADPQFKDNMTTAIKVILKRTAASQI
ncbi:MAG: NIPSNAP family protein [Verrucomicrobiae bacterium]|nr:NIPSNAP family protein [Verrucomicrobiae bacterium]